MSGSQQLILGEGAGGSGVANYIEDVFSTYLYTGNGTSQTITNGIDLSTKGGLVWIKNRNGAGNHRLFDTARGLGSTGILNSNLENAASSSSNWFNSFNSDGFTTGVNLNSSGDTLATWTFRKQPKFFDVVTYTGNGVDGRSISHNLGSVPGCIIVKRTDQAANWAVYHRGVNGGVNPQNYKLLLNLTNAQALDNWWNNSAPTSTAFQVSSDPTVNDGATGATYVAYLFAHNAGGFGLTGTDNVISCGSLSGAGTTVNLGYEPQWILAKRTDTTGNWYIDDNMRGWPAAPGNDNPLLANTSGAEPTGFAGFANITSTGFTNNFNGDYIYIAIRRGPMKTPTTGTSVYNAIARTGTSATATVTGVGFPPDLAVIKDRIGTTGANWLDRLRGPNLSIRSNNTADEVAAPDVLSSYDQNGVTLGSDTNGVLGTNTSGNAMINWFFRRAPGFFDVVCYTGTGVNRTVTHNLGVAPELMIVKRRDSTGQWTVYSSALLNTEFLVLNSSSPTQASTAVWNSTTPTASVFYLGNVATVNSSTSTSTYVNYLFATCPGVSKVGSYTGNGSSQTINCGFTGGARWVMIKRTDSTGDWYVWDSTRGIVAGNDPRIRIGVGAAEDTTDDSLDTNSTGFIVNQDAATNINVSSASYIFLAIA